MEKPEIKEPIRRWRAPWWPSVWVRLTHAPRSLRLRLALWYGGLLAALLAIFAVLVLSVATQSLEAGVQSAIEAETRVALLDLDHQLAPTPPYWPDHLTLTAVDTYRDPGVTVEVIGQGGRLLYHSGTDGVTTLPSGRALEHGALSGQVAWATIRINAEPVRLEAVPIRAPEPATANAAGTGPVVGVLLVAKSLRDVSDTLALLRSVLLAAGVLAFVGALAGGWAIAGRVLHPLAELGATAADIARATRRGTQVGGLSRRVPHPGGNDELARVVSTVNAMLAALERAATTQRRFVADASHELRAPLTTIQGNLAILQRHEVDIPAEERRVMLGDAYAETLRLARLVDDLLLLARADAQAEAPGADDSSRGEAVPAAAPLEAVEVDREVLHLVRGLRGRLQAEGRHTTLAVGHIEPARVRADQETIRRIALILLDNAIKYTHRSLAGEALAQPSERVTVALRREGGMAVLSVADNGVGIAPADLTHIFERFYRADQARDRAGTGLGLAIASELVERLGGTISVESRLGEGTTFSVRLPLADADQR